MSGPYAPVTSSEAASVCGKFYSNWLALRRTKTRSNQLYKVVLVVVIVSGGWRSITYSGSIHRYILIFLMCVISITDDME